MGRRPVYIDAADRARAHRERQADARAAADFALMCASNPTPVYVAKLVERYLTQAADRPTAQAVMRFALRDLLEGN